MLLTTGTFVWDQTDSSVDTSIAGTGSLVVGNGVGTTTFQIRDSAASTTNTHVLSVATSIKPQSVMLFTTLDRFELDNVITVEAQASVVFANSIAADITFFQATTGTVAYWDISGTVTSNSGSHILMGEVWLRYPSGSLAVTVSGGSLDFTTLRIYYSPTAYYVPRCCSVSGVDSLSATGLTSTSGFVLEDGMVLFIDADDTSDISWTSTTIQVTHGGILIVDGQGTVTLSSLIVNSGVVGGTGSIIVTNSFIWRHDSLTTVATQLSGSGSITLKSATAGNNVITATSWGDPGKMFLSRTLIVDTGAQLTIRTNGYWDVFDTDGLLLINTGATVTLASAGSRPAAYSATATCPRGISCPTAGVVYASYISLPSNQNLRTPIRNKGSFLATSVSGDIVFGPLDNQALVDTTGTARLLLSDYDYTRSGASVLDTVYPESSALTVVKFGPNTIANTATTSLYSAGPISFDIYDPNGDGVFTDTISSAYFTLSSDSTGNTVNGLLSLKGRGLVLALVGDLPGAITLRNSLNIDGASISGSSTITVTQDVVWSETIAEARALKPLSTLGGSGTLAISGQLSILTHTNLVATQTQLRTIGMARIISCRGSVTIAATPISFESYIIVESTCGTITINGFNYGDGSLWGGVTQTVVTIYGTAPVASNFQLIVTGNAKVIVKSGSTLALKQLSLTGSSLTINSNSAVTVDGSTATVITASSTVTVGPSSTLTIATTTAAATTTISASTFAVDNGASVLINTASPTFITSSTLTVAGVATVTISSLNQATTFDSSTLSIGTGSKVTLNTRATVAWLQTSGTASTTISGTGQLIVGDGTTTTTLLIQEQTLATTAFVASNTFKHILSVPTQIKTNSVLSFGPLDTLQIGSVVTVDVGASVVFDTSMNTYPGGLPAVTITTTPSGTAYWDITGSVTSNFQNSVQMGDVYLRFPTGVISATTVGPITFTSLRVFISANSFYTPRCCVVSGLTALRADGTGIGNDILVEQGMLFSIDTKDMLAAPYTWNTVSIRVKNGGVFQVHNNAELVLKDLEVDSGILSGSGSVRVLQTFVWKNEANTALSSQISGSGGLHIVGTATINAQRYATGAMYLLRNITLEATSTLALSTAGSFEVWDARGFVVVSAGATVTLTASPATATAYTPTAACASHVCTNLLSPDTYANYIIGNLLARSNIVNLGTFSATGITGNVNFGSFLNMGSLDTTSGATLLFTNFDIYHDNQYWFNTLSDQAYDDMIVQFGPNTVSGIATPQLVTGPISLISDGLTSSALFSVSTNSASNTFDGDLYLKGRNLRLDLAGDLPQTVIITQAFRLDGALLTGVGDVTAQDVTWDETITSAAASQPRSRLSGEGLLTVTGTFLVNVHTNPTTATQLRVIDESRVIVCAGTVIIQATPLEFDSHILVTDSCSSITVTGFAYGVGWNGVTQTVVRLSGSATDPFDLTLTNDAQVIVLASSTLNVRTLSLDSSDLTIEEKATLTVQTMSWEQNVADPDVSAVSGSGLLTVTTLTVTGTGTGAHAVSVPLEIVYMNLDSFATFTITEPGYVQVSGVLTIRDTGVITTTQSHWSLQSTGSIVTAFGSTNSQDMGDIIMYVGATIDASNGNLIFSSIQIYYTATEYYFPRCCYVTGLYPSSSNGPLVDNVFMSIDADVSSFPELNVVNGGILEVRGTGPLQVDRLYVDSGIIYGSGDIEVASEFVWTHESVPDINTQFGGSGELTLLQGSRATINAADYGVGKKYLFKKIHNLGDLDVLTNDKVNIWGSLGLLDNQPSGKIVIRAAPLTPAPTFGDTSQCLFICPPSDAFRPPEFPGLGDAISPWENRGGVTTSTVASTAIVLGGVTNYDTGLITAVSQALDFSNLGIISSDGIWFNNPFFQVTSTAIISLKGTATSGVWTGSLTVADPNPLRTPFQASTKDQVFDSFSLFGRETSIQLDGEKLNGLAEINVNDFVLDGARVIGYGDINLFRSFTWIETQPFLPNAQWPLLGGFGNLVMQTGSSVTIAVHSGVPALRVVSEYRNILCNGPITIAATPIKFMGKIYVGSGCDIDITGFDYSTPGDWGGITRTDIVIDGSSGNTFDLKLTANAHVTLTGADLVIDTLLVDASSITFSSGTLSVRSFNWLRTTPTVVSTLDGTTNVIVDDFVIDHAEVGLNRLIVPVNVTQNLTVGSSNSLSLESMLTVLQNANATFTVGESTDGMIDTVNGGIWNFAGQVYGTFGPALKIFLGDAILRGGGTLNGIDGPLEFRTLLVYVGSIQTYYSACCHISGVFPLPNFAGVLAENNEYVVLDPFLDPLHVEIRILSGATVEIRAGSLTTRRLRIDSAKLLGEGDVTVTELLT